MKNQIDKLVELGVSHFDCMVARYNPEFRQTAMYIEKKYYERMTAEELLSMQGELEALNGENFNIYVRDSDFYNSRLLVIDDCMASSVQDVHAKMKALGRRAQFVIETSQASMYNYQVGFVHDKPLAHSARILKKVCEDLNGDKKHAKLGKFFRLAGFENKKPSDEAGLFDYKERKNHMVKFF